MATKLTGNAEIDQQHAILESIAAQAGSYCVEAKRRPNLSCSECSSYNQQHCAASLQASARELRVFLVGHNTYEEKLMELLPSTQPCQAHVKEHKRAHEQIARELKIFSVQVAEKSPKVAVALLVKLVRDWLGNHILNHDNHLARHLSNTDISEINFDGELVTMLDEHVFRNRPIMTNSSPSTVLALSRKKLEARGRFELLSRAQRAVFWLVIDGKTNREIAAELGSSVNTVKSHRAAIFQKMEVRSVLELVKKVDVLRQVYVAR